MIIPDVNLLVYAVFDDYPQHARARAWLEDTMNGPEGVGLTVPAVFGFIRISTSGRVHERPMSVTTAGSHVQEWLARPVTTLLTPGHDHVRIALGLLEALGTGANLTTDAQLAAYALESGGTVHSTDHDFGRFPGLRWVDPLTPTT